MAQGIVSTRAPETSVHPSAKAADSNDYRRAWELYTSLEHQVQVADRKVQAIFSVNALLVAALSLQAQRSLSVVFANGFSVAAILSVVGHAALLTLVGAATLSAISALRPRMRLGRRRATSCYFFGDIAASDPERFVRAFTELPPEDATEQVLEQAHTVASILAEKYRWSGRATSALTASLIVWIALEVLRFGG